MTNALSMDFKSDPAEFMFFWNPEESGNRVFADTTKHIHAEIRLSAARLIYFMTDALEPDLLIRHVGKPMTLALQTCL